MGHRGYRVRDIVREEYPIGLLYKDPDYETYYFDAEAGKEITKTEYDASYKEAEKQTISISR